MNAFARRTSLMVVVSITLLGSVADMRADDPLAPPESVGFSTEGLKAYQQAMHALVDDAKLVQILSRDLHIGRRVLGP